MPPRNKKRQRDTAQRNNTAQHNNTAQRSNTAAGDLGELASEAARLAAAEEQATEETAAMLAEEGLPAASEDGQANGTEATGTEATGGIDVEQLRQAIVQAKRAHTLGDRRAANFTAAKTELEKKHRAEMDRLASGVDKLAADRAAHEAEVAKLDEREKALAGREKQVAERAQRVLEQEAEAKSGFAGFRDEQLQRLRTELDGRRTAFDDELREKEDRQAKRFAEQEKRLSERTAELEERSAQLDGTGLEQRRMGRRLEAREEFLNQEVDDRVKDLRSKHAAELELERQNALGWQQRYEKVRELAEKRAQELARHEAAAVELGGRAAPEVKAELDRLRTENAELKARVVAEPAGNAEYVAGLQARVHDLTVEHGELLQANADLRRHVAAAKISAVERENSRMINQALERLNRTLSDEIHQHTVKLEQLQADAQVSSPFPACFGMDADRSLAYRPDLPDRLVDLAELVGLVRRRMAAALGLYYSVPDMRCFLAGLAASRLHLLQGISGIGKSRLPEAFARVIGAGCEMVAVAAEWRSPQDLLGYYNPFERKFYETDFTQALYKAQLPLYKDKPFLIVLDEMNLSHPEQYFSDLLSALERKEGDPAERPLIRLMTSRVDPAPALLRDGRAIELPDNVWFIGTANNDETTVRFADKTYDRSHVLELPSSPVRFEVDEPEPLLPVSLKNLQSSFDRAVHKHKGETDQVLEFFDKELGPRLRDEFGVSWGSRLQRQARRFVPVTVGAGGAAGEAADHLLATKILRKLSGRVDIPVGDLRALEGLIQARWTAAFAGTDPSRSLRALRAEIRSRGTA
ncbi:AAA family ATPase [Actinomadura sp. 3N508]|uniref:AAA family ATPase n=1 Tax=Actinomadura sp. 3N508 TaxID=3375153 RepID=UPI0037A10C01